MFCRRKFTSVNFNTSYVSVSVRIRNLSKKCDKSVRKLRSHIKRPNFFWASSIEGTVPHVPFLTYIITPYMRKTYCMKQADKLSNIPTDIVFKKNLLAGPWPISLKPLTWISYSVCATSFFRTVFVKLLEILTSL